MTPSRDEITAKLQEIEAAITALQKALEGPALAVALAPLLEKRAQYRVQAQNVGIIGDAAHVEDGIHYHQPGQQVDTQTNIGNYHDHSTHYTAPPGADPATLRARYLRELARATNRLPWTNVAQDYADPESGEGLGLAAVYTQLDTTALERVTCEAELRDFMACLERDAARRVPAQTLLDREKRLLILGDPGSGKSTLVNYLAYILAQAGNAADAAPWLARLDPWGHGVLLPLRVELRHFAAWAADQPRNRGGLLAYLPELLIAWGLDEFWPTLCESIQHPDAPLLFLLDGLDEVPTAQRGAVVQAVQDFARHYAQHRYVVTCRPYAYVGQPWPLRGFKEVTLAPFSQEQQHAFIATWYSELARRGRIAEAEGQERVQQLQTAIQRRDLQGLAQRPLLLTVMALLHSFRGQLPDDRTELYADAVDLLLRRWERRVGAELGVIEQLALPGLKASDLEAGLYEVAYRAHSGTVEAAGTADVDEGDLRQWLAPYLGKDWNKAGLFVEYIRERAGLLVRHKTAAYTFPHRTFQEFMAACHLVGLEDYPREAAQHVQSDAARWREVFILAAGHAARTHRLGQAIAAVNALCPRELADVARPKAEDFLAAELAGEALLEIGLIGVQREASGQAAQNRVRRWLVAALRADKELLAARQRAQAGNVLAQLGDPRDFDELIDIPAGPFLMGSDPAQDQQAYGDEQPQHEVTLPAYRIGKYPVTVGQFRRFVVESGYKPRDNRCPEGIANHPVVNVTWHDARAYCAWLTEVWRAAGKITVAEEVRLSTEAEWEKAARGTEGLIYPWGDEPDPERANYDKTGIGSTSAVGCFPGGASPYGCLDMAGNVWEWTRSIEQDYPYKADDSREDLEGKGLRVQRGGSWNNNARVARCAYRYRYFPDYFNDNYGFRMVVSLVLS